MKALKLSPSVVFAIHLWLCCIYFAWIPWFWGLFLSYYQIKTSTWVGDNKIALILSFYIYSASYGSFHHRKLHAEAWSRSVFNRLFVCRSYDNQSAPVEVPHLYLSRNRWKLNMSCIYTWKHLVSTECGEKLFDEHLEEAFSHSPKAEKRRKKKTQRVFP